jgi:NarL family two-component system response regulator LiaR
MTIGKIGILIADDHPVVRRGLRALIETEPQMEVLGEATDGVEAVQKAKSLNPDVILLDLVMPKKDGISAISDIKGDNPEARILVLTSFAEDEQVMPAIKAGALGYLLKDSSPAELIAAIREIFEGGSSLDPAVARRLVSEVTQPAGRDAGIDELTDREVDVLRVLAKGMSNQEIAEQLSLSERTVGKHVSNVLVKLNVTNRTQAALYAVREGLADADAPSH